MSDRSDQDFGLVRTASNILSNIGLFAIDILISLWYTPYLVRKVGSELFGFVPLANSLTGFMSIITYSLNISTGRYITIELEKGNDRRANQVFNTTLVGTALLISIVIPVGVFLILLAPTIFSIPPGMERQVRLLFVGVLAAFYISVLSVNFNVATFAANRFDLRNIVKFLARLGQIVVIVLLFTLDHPKLAYIGLGALCAAFLGFIGDFVLWKRLLPALMIKFNDFRKENLGLLFRTGSWTLIYQVGFILFLNVDMLVANLALDLSVAGMYGALLVIPKNLRVLSMSIGGVWGPPLLARYSQGDVAGMDRILRLSIKVVGLSMALPVGLVCGLAGPFLLIWLGPEFQTMTAVLILMIFHLASNLIVGPFFNIHISFNKLRIPALFACGFGVANLVLTILFAERFGALGIALSGAFTLSAYYSLFVPFYSAQIMGYPWWRYLSNLASIYIACLSVAAAGYYTTRIFPIISLFHLALVGLMISILYLLVIYQLGLTKIEKGIILSLIKRRIP